MNPDDRRTWPRPAVRGNDRYAGHKQMTVRFDDQQFEAIRDMAQRRGTSFTDMVRCLCEWGLEQDKE